MLLVVARGACRKASDLVAGGIFTRVYVNSLNPTRVGFEMTHVGLEMARVGLEMTRVGFEMTRVTVIPNFDDACRI